MNIRIWIHYIPQIKHKQKIDFDRNSCILSQNIKYILLGIVQIKISYSKYYFYLSVNAATPGNIFPSRNSSDAPPPVET